MQRKTSPIVRRAPALLLPHFHLSRAQVLGWSHLLLPQHRPVNPLHQLRRGRILHSPQARHRSAQFRVRPVQESIRGKMRYSVLAQFCALPTGLSTSISFLFLSCEHRISVESREQPKERLFAQIQDFHSGFQGRGSDETLTHSPTTICGKPAVVREDAAGYQDSRRTSGGAKGQ